MRKAIVIRGCGIRGDFTKKEGSILTVCEPGQVPRSTDEISNQEYDELRAHNYVKAYLEPPAPVVDTKKKKDD